MINPFRSFIRLLYLARYGRRLSLKPPLGLSAHRRNSFLAILLYHYRYFFWQIESRIYQWTGIPAEEQAHFMKTVRDTLEIDRRAYAGFQKRDEIQRLRDIQRRSL